MEHVLPFSWRQERKVLSLFILAMLTFLTFHVLCVGMKLCYVTVGKNISRVTTLVSELSSMELVSRDTSRVKVGNLFNILRRTRQVN